MTIPRTNGATVQAAQPDTTIYITRFRSLTVPQGESESYADWEELVADFEANYDVIAEKKDGQGWAPATFSGDMRSKRNVERVSCLVFDYDKGTTTMQAAFDFWCWAAFAAFEKQPFTTACLVHTSYSHTEEHPKFRVILPLSRAVDGNEYEAIWSFCAELAAKAGHELDQACKDASRMWFFPACKPGSEVAFLFTENAQHVDVRRILKECGYRKKTKGTKASSESVLSSASRFFEKGIDQIRDAAQGERNQVLNRVAYVAGRYIAGGRLNEDRVRREVFEAGVACGLDPSEVENTLHGAIERGKDDPYDDKPEVKLDGELHERISDAMKALAEHPNVFQKDGKLVCIGKSVANGVELISMGETRVQEMMSECANWMVFAAKETDYKKTQPPKRLAEHLVKRGDWEFIKPIHAVTAFPVLNPSGRLHSAKGFDDVTKTYFAGSVDVQVPDAPTVEDAKAAVGVLLDVVGDFPFVNDAHKSAWLAALLSPLSRYMHEGNIPLVVIQANDRRVGKSKLATIIGMIVTGKMPATMTHVANGEEERKRIGTILMAGYPVVLIDNVESQFGTGGNMNALITSRVYMDRKLGENAALRAENNATWIVNGKNMTLAPDMAQRSLHIRLQCDEEKPELRDGFKYPNLERHVQEHRAELLGAALIILRGYVVAGMPAQNLSAWGSFESWSNLIRGALVWAGLPDPALTREELEEEADTELSFEVGLIEGWDEGLRHFEMPDGMTASEMLKRLDQNDSSVCPILREALVTITPPRMTLPTPKKLGYELSKVKRKVRNGLSIEPVGSGKDALRWVVVPKT